jgi:hypothetical protein
MRPGYVANLKAGRKWFSTAMSEQQQNPWTAGGPPTGAPQYAAAPPQPGTGPLGEVRSSWACVGLTIITLGFYTWYWFFKVHEEMKRHTGRGLGGGIALLITIVFGVAMPFLTSSEVGTLYESRGRPKPVSGVTGLWNFPGCFIIVGPFIWFFKTNGALNDYWRALGAR